jgi:hypothetical protein
MLVHCAPLGFAIKTILVNSCEAGVRLPAVPYSMETSKMMGGIFLFFGDVLRSADSISTGTRRFAPLSACQQLSSLSRCWPTHWSPVAVFLEWKFIMNYWVVLYIPFGLVFWHAAKW